MSEGPTSPHDVAIQFAVRSPRELLDLYPVGEVERPGGSGQPSARSADPSRTALQSGSSVKARKSRCDPRADCER